MSSNEPADHGDNDRRAQDIICRRIAAGESLPSICRDAGLPNVTVVLSWLDDGRRAAFRKRFNRAQVARRDVLAEQILDIADGVARPNTHDGQPEQTALDREALQLAKLRIDARKWLMVRTDSVAASPPETGAAGLWRELLDALDGRNRGLPAGVGSLTPRPAGPPNAESRRDEHERSGDDEDAD